MSDMNEKNFEAVLAQLRGGNVPEDFLEAATYADNALREQRRLMAAMTDCISRLWNSYRLHRKILAVCRGREEKRLRDGGMETWDAMKRAEIVLFLRTLAAEAAIAEEAGEKDPENLKSRRSEKLNRAADMVAGKI